MVQYIALLFVILEILPDDFTVTGSQTALKCKPYKAYIVWDTCSEEISSLHTGRKLIVKLIQEMPNDSVISIKVVGTTASIRFIKNDSDSTWLHKVGDVKEGSSRNYSISYKIIRDHHFDVCNMSMAEEFFFMLNNCSTIEDRKLIEALRTKKTFVAVTGQSEQLYIWTNIATDEDHVLLLNASGETDVEAFLDLSCKDSKFICDTDMYWDGSRCFRCSYICTKIRSDFCRDECPYFGEPADKYKVVPEINNCDNTSIDVLSVCTLLSSIFSSILLLIMLVKKKISQSLSSCIRNDDDRTNNGTDNNDINN